MDLGCGSGRDVKWFRDHGYEAYGLDASEELVSKACEEFDIPVEVGFIEEWVSEEPFDGIWCCASLMHLDDEQLNQFFANLQYNLKPGGALFLSVKTGIETGFDDAGRYLRNYIEEDFNKLVSNFPGHTIVKCWYTNDKLSRNNFKWLNAIFIRD